MIKELVVTRSTEANEILTAFHDMLCQYPSVDVCIKPRYSFRTDNQNALYQVWVKEICEQSGLYNSFKTKAKAEEYLKSQIKERACLHGYPYKRDENGELMTDEEGKMIPCSSTEVSISDFKILLEACQLVAIENDIILTDINNN